MSDQEEGANVSWLNFTKADWGGETKYFPLVWDRNSNNIWPWVADYANPDYGTKTWVMITLVATGETYEADADGATRVHSKLYVNGELKIDSLYIYNQALSDTQVADLYKLGNATVESVRPGDTATE